MEAKPRNAKASPAGVDNRKLLVHVMARLMEPAILGISAYYHDSAAALVRGGEIVAAAQEERFSRTKHDERFPREAVEYCLREGGIGPADLAYVVFYEKPLLKFDRLIATHLARAPSGIRSFLQGVPGWLRTKLHLPREIRKALGGEFKKRIAFTSHHEAHAASAFFPSPFDEAAIVTMDGVGEWETGTIGIGRGKRIELLRASHFPHSLGLLYSAFTHFCGFRVNSGEYKLMGLAPYGEPRFAGLIREHLIDLKKDGSFRLDLSYFNFAAGLAMTNQRFAQLFGGAPRKPESEITRREMDLAASIQEVTAEVVLRTARTARRISGAKNLVLAGGVALNCVANARIVEARVFDNVWIPSAAGDAGGALGAALFVAHQLLGIDRETGKAARSTIQDSAEQCREMNGSESRQDGLRGALLGPEYSPDFVHGWLSQQGIAFSQYATEQELLEVVSAALVDGAVVGWFQGRMEFGPRALGARSILADPRNPAMQSQLNLRIKFRESFRPFAPSCLAERASAWFALDGESPYMLLTASVCAEHRIPLSAEQAQIIREEPDLRRRVNIPRTTIPAVTHVDYSARVQTVTEERNGIFYRLIREFERKTGCPILVNTSFNIRGEPIVCSPSDAFRCFRNTQMDMLVMENCVLVRSEQPALPAADREFYQSKFLSD
jgi:carbamoyltransferase